MEVRRIHAYWKQVFLMLLLVAMGQQLCAQQKKMELDLTGWDGQPMSINGDWEFYWNRHVSLDSSGVIELDNPIHLPTNKNWRKLSDSLFWKPFGIGVYHLRLTNCSIEEIAIRTEMLVSSSYRLFANDSLIGSLGSTGVHGSYVPEIDKKINYTSNPTGTVDLYLEVANYDLGAGGPLSQVTIGQRKTLAQKSMVRLILEIAVVAFTLSIAFRSLVLYLLDTSKTAHFSLCALLFMSSLRCFMIGEVPVKYFWSEIPYPLHERLRTFGFIVGLSFGYKFAKDIAKAGIERSYFRVLQYTLLVLGVGVLVTPTWFHTNISIFSQLIILIGLVIVLKYWIGQVRMDRSALLILLGMVIFSVAFIHDVCASRQLIEYKVIQHYGVFLFAIIYSVYLNIHFTKRDKKLRAISSDIQEISVLNEGRINLDSVVVEELRKIKTSLDSNSAKKEVSDVIRQINQQNFWTQKQSEALSNVSNEGDNFKEILNRNFPNLTKGERELCLLLKAKLSTKEIAEVRNITVDSAKLARKRLRKKLGLDPAQDLQEFIDGLT